MAPDDRRAALIRAALPLLREHGAAVTTRQIADAAGVAEGTIFGVFPDKNSLIVATLLSVLHPERGLGEMQNLAAVGDLRERLTAAVDRLARGLEIVGPLLTVARSLPATHAAELFERLGAGRKTMQSNIAELIEPDRAQLRTSPETAARLVMSVVFAAARNEWSAGESLSSEELVTVLLEGLLIRTDSGGKA